MDELGGIEGVAQIEPSGRRISESQFANAYPFPLPGAAARRAQAYTGANHHGNAQTSGRASKLSAEHQLAHRTGERRRKHLVPDRATNPWAGPRSNRRVLEARAGWSAEVSRASPSRRSALNVSNPEIHVAIDRKRAADLGVRMETIGNTLRLAVSGDDEISFYKEGQEQSPGQDPRARKPAWRHRTDRAPDGSGAHWPGSHRQYRSLQRGLGPTTLQRSDRQFAVMFISDVAPGHALDEATNDVRKMLTGLNMPPTMSFKFQGQSKILDETTANMIMAISLAMIFVYMVLASQFESFLQPVVIMLVLPIAVPFALFTLWVTGRTLNLGAPSGCCCCSDREEELDPAGRLCQRVARPRPAAARRHRRIVPDAAASDPDDDDGDHRWTDSNVAGHRHRRDWSRGDRRDHHWWAGAVSLPHPAARTSRLRPVRRAGAGPGRQEREGVAGRHLGLYVWSTSACSERALRVKRTAVRACRSPGIQIKT